MARPVAAPHARTSPVQGSGASGPGARFRRFRFLATRVVLAVRHPWPATRLTTRAAYPHQPAAEDPGERGPGLVLKQARAPSAEHRERATTLAGQSRVCRRVMPGRGRAVSTTRAGPVCNRNRVPDGDCQDGLWGQVAVWPPNFVRVAWEPAAPVHCPPWWPRAPTTLLWDAQRRGQSRDGVLQRLAGLPVGVVPALARTGQGLGALSSRRPEAGFPLPLTDGAAGASVTCLQAKRRGARG